MKRKCPKLLPKKILFRHIQVYLDGPFISGPGYDSVRVDYFDEIGGNLRVEPRARAFNVVLRGASAQLLIGAYSRVFRETCMLPIYQLLVIAQAYFE